MGTPIWKGTSGLIFQPESGKITLSDRATSQDIYKGPQAACYAGLLRRGTYGTGERLGLVVTSSVQENERGGIGKLTINWEAGGPSANAAFLPLPEFDSQVVELYPKIERNKYFNGIDRPTIGLAFSSVFGATTAARFSAYADLLKLSDPLLTLGKKLVLKLQLGEDSFYLAGMRYMYISYSFTPPALSMGGVIESPSFVTTFSIRDGSGNPYSWLRLADFVQTSGVNGSAYKLTSTWLGGPLGYWDPDIYV